jgi:hypothetical protein
MSAIVRSAAIFASVAFAATVLVDVLLSALVAPATPVSHRQGVLLAHAMFHVAVLALSFAGSLVGFACVRRRLPTRGGAILLGATFALVSLLGGAVVAVVEGPLLAGLWLTFGSMAFAIGGSLLAKPWRAEGHA